jgi:hypothetical protein
VGAFELFAQGHKSGIQPLFATRVINPESLPNSLTERDPAQRLHYPRKTLLRHANDSLL